MVNIWEKLEVGITNPILTGQLSLGTPQSGKDTLNLLYFYSEM